MYATNRQEHVLILFGVLLACLIFIFDLFLRHDVAVSVPYLAVVALTLWIRSTHQTVLLAGLCTLLSILGFFFSPPGESLLLAATNRVLSLVGIWVVVLVSVQSKRVEEERLKFQTRLQVAVNDRTYALYRENRVLKDEVRMLQNEQHRLIQLGERFRAFTDQAPVMIWMADDRGACFYVNEAWIAFTGRPFEQELGHGWTDSLHPTDLEPTLHITRQALQRESTFDLEFRLRHAEGTYRWIHASGLPRFDDGQNLNGYLMVCQDVHDPKMAMNELMEAKEALRLSAEKLAETKTELAGRTQALSEALDALNTTTSPEDFLADLSHRVRTPLSSILGYADILLDTPLEMDQRDYVRTIRSSGQALLDLLNQTANPDHATPPHTPDARPIDPERDGFDVRSLVDDACAFIEPGAAARDVRVSGTLDPGIPSRLVGDEVLLRQVLVSLLTHALQLSLAGGHIRVTGRSKPAGDDRHTLHLSVGDGETSLDETRRRAFFTLLTRDVPEDALDAAPQDPESSGLIHSKRLAERLGGKVWAESEIDRGFAFHCRFNLRLPDTAGPLLPDTDSRLTGQTLLIVCADDDARHRMARLAQTWGMRVLATDDWREALTWFETGVSFDVCLLDAPSENGDAEAARLLHAHTESVGIPFLVLNAEDRGKRAGNGHLDNPISQAQLYRQLVALMPDTEVASGAENGVEAGIESRLALDPVPAPAPLLVPSRRILLVEDETSNQKLAQHLLQELGHTVDVARNGQEALAALDRSAYDVVLMDIKMPVMDGLETTRRIREAVSDAAQPQIIAVTARAMEGDRERFLNAGMDDYISKPYTVHRLADALQRVAVPPSRPPVS